LSCTVQVANHQKAIGLLHAGVQTAANAGVPEDHAGLAAALITASVQLGSALGLAVLSGIATSRTSHLLAARTPPPEALTAGFQRALLVSALCLVAAGAIALRASHTRSQPAATPEPWSSCQTTRSWSFHGGANAEIGFPGLRVLDRQSRLTAHDRQRAVSA
jgi:hypothetical protein